VFNFRDVRTLWSLAAIIWGVGVILAVTVLVPSAFGISVDIGVIVNGLVAIGSFAAAAAALWSPRGSGKSTSKIAPTAIGSRPD